MCTVGSENSEVEIVNNSRKRRYKDMQAEDLEALEAGFGAQDSSEASGSQKENHKVGKSVSDRSDTQYSKTGRVDQLRSTPHQDMCCICLCEPTQPVNLCTEEHDAVCANCMCNLVNNTLNGAYMGTCPPIICPSSAHHETKKRKIIPYNNWKQLVTADVSSRYCSLASSLLAFLCGGCHTLKSLDNGYEANLKVTNDILRSALLSGVSLDNFHELIARYTCADITVDETYSQLRSNIFPQIACATDEQSWTIFKNVLRSIEDPERRANLHLRYLRERPRIKTLCCKREHCFSCKIKDYHEGKTCAELTNTLDHSIVNCPTCGIGLAKGDGCNTIICVCGKQFSWSAEKETMERCQAFLEKYPSQTSKSCAEVLCTQLSGVELIRAKAWQSRHSTSVNIELKSWFTHRYWPCPTQCCVILQSEVLPDGIRDAMQLWKNDHPIEIEHRKTQNDIALRSIFVSLYPDPKEQPLHAHRFVVATRRGKKEQNSIDPRLLKSVFKWVEENRDVYTKGVIEMEERSARQFLFLYGSRPLSTIKSTQSSCPSSLEWCRITSNPDLTYTNDSTVERTGSISCYPAAFCNLVSERAMFRVIIDHAPRSSNWLTFGVARKGMPTASSDGVGRTPNTWGISDDRSSYSSSIIAASGLEVGFFRKLQVGDILMAVIDTIDGWCEISVNDFEFVHRFTIPHGTVEDYCFAMTFANDHRVTILNDHVVGRKDGIFGQQGTPPPKGELNQDHFVMLSHLKKQVKLILSEPTDKSGQTTSNNLYATESGLMTDGSEWLRRWDGNIVIATEQYEKIRSDIDEYFGVRHQPRETDAEGHIIPFSLENSLLGSMCAYEVLNAVSWYRLNRDRIKAEQRMEMAVRFSAVHGDDAPFIAAITLMEFQSHNSTNSLVLNISFINAGGELGCNVSQEVMAALSYMAQFPDEMNEWYDYDAHSKEPMIEHVAPNCRCLPRHIRRCGVHKPVG